MIEKFGIKLSYKLASMHIKAAQISENHLDQMAGGIKITPRNLSFIIADKNKSEFKDNKVDETLRWIKSILLLDYFNSFIDSQN